MNRQLRVLLVALTAAMLGCSFEFPPPDCDEQHALATRCFDGHSPYGLSYEICTPFWAGGFDWEDVSCTVDGGEPCVRGGLTSGPVIPGTICWYGRCYCAAKFRGAEG
jgi:hypothetical protein